jgi:formiminotetrahydrofolate cyclodeaminase
VKEVRSQTVGAFLEEVSSASPTPGGGSVAALAGALACGLGLMVCAIGSKKEGTAALAELDGRLRPLRERFLDLVVEDAAAFDSVMRALRLPKEDVARPEAIESALKGAAEVPLETAGRSVELLDRLVALAPLGTRQSTSDVGVAAILGKAALDAALLNVDINLAYLKDGRSSAEYTARRADLAEKGVRLAEEVLAVVRARI